MRNNDHGLTGSAMIASVGPGVITVVVGEFDPLVSLGLIAVLERDRAFRIVASNVDAPALARVVAWKAPRLAILDERSVDGSSLAGMLALDVLLAVVVLGQNPCLACAADVEASRVTRLARSASAMNLRAGFHLAVAGRDVARTREVLALEGTPDRQALASLTRREIEVLSRLSEGQRHMDIAKQLHIAKETARKHSASIRRKLGVRDNGELLGFPVPDTLRADAHKPMSVRSRGLRRVSRMGTHLGTPGYPDNPRKMRGKEPKNNPG